MIKQVNQTLHDTNRGRTSLTALSREQAILKFDSSFWTKILLEGKSQVKCEYYSISFKALFFSAPAFAREIFRESESPLPCGSHYRSNAILRYTHY